MTRRDLLRTGAVTGAGALLAGCATPGMTSVNDAATLPPADGPIRLQYWTWLKDLQKVADLWNAQNPDVQVDVSWIPGGNGGGYQRLYAALAAGDGPDLAQVEMRTIPQFLLINGLTDLSRYGIDSYAPLYNEALWQQVSFVGGVYGIPQDSGPMGTFYRPDLLDEVGAGPPETWEQWAEIAREVRTTGAWMDCFNIADGSWFAAMAQQAGARWFAIEDDTWVIDMTDDATMTVARFFDTAIDDGLMTPAYGQYTTPWYAAAANDQIATATSASWGEALLRGVQGSEGKWRAAPMPRWETGYASSLLGGSTAAVLADSRYPKEAMEFGVWMTTSQEGIDAMVEFSGIGWSPSADYIGAAREGEEEYFGGQAASTDVFEPAAQPDAQSPDWTWWPIVQQSFSILADGFRQKSSGTSLVDSVAASQDRIVEAMVAKGLDVRVAGA